ncbi:hypothetical protein ACWD26_40455 [Streptomyces sp. NPDC002787]
MLRERRAVCPVLDMGLLAHPGFHFNARAATLAMFALSGLVCVLPPYVRVAQSVAERFGSRARDVRRPRQPAHRPGRLGHTPTPSSQWGEAPGC